ncbi:MAG TPA: sulfatase [Chthoniobacteraceae bacterium]|nr:sulfatase [Chthoniobacteraceae bacterium]
MRIPSPLVLLSMFAASHAADRPNILFIMSDDHAAHAVSCYGSKVNQTPNMDRLAKEGTRFVNAFVTNSICTPSRATILTGKYSHLNGTPVFNRFDGAQQTVAKLLQSAGYYTGMIGKWHLGSDPTGFDRWIVLPGQGVYFNPIFLTPEGRLTVQGYVSDVITDLGVQWLETRPKEKPFFLMLHHKAPHRAWEPDPKNRALFAQRTIPEPATLFDDYKTRPAALPENEQTVAKDFTRRDLKLDPPTDLTTPERNKWLNAKPDAVEITGPDGEKKTLDGEALVHWKYQRYMQDYLACVQGVDDNIGRILDYLEKTGLAKNTIVIYTADNGFFLGDLGLYDKRFMYEPSLHVPLLVRGPGVKAGAVTELFALNNDFAPTFLELAGQPMPEDMQGRSLVPILKGESPADWRTSIYYRYYHDPGHHNTHAHYGVRTATHKLIYYWKQDAWEMFDLVADPTEQKNLSNDPAQKAKFDELKAELLRLKKAFKDDDQFSTELPKDGVDGEFADRKRLGVKTIAEAIKLSVAK